MPMTITVSSLIFGMITCLLGASDSWLSMVRLTWLARLYSPTW